MTNVNVIFECYIQNRRGFWLARGFLVFVVRYCSDIWFEISTFLCKLEIGGLLFDEIQSCQAAIWKVESWKNKEVHVHLIFEDLNILKNFLEKWKHCVDLRTFSKGEWKETAIVQVRGDECTLWAWKIQG